MKHTTESLAKEKLVIAFMPIRPIYAERILDGSKKYEFRRTKLRSDLTHIVIYASSPIQRIIGIAEVISVETKSVTATWECTKHRAGISRAGYREYFSDARGATAIAIGKVLKLDFEVRPSEVINEFKIPQAFTYVSPEFVDIVIRKGMPKWKESAKVPFSSLVESTA